MNKLFKKSILSFAFLAIISLCLTNGKYLERVKAATSCPAGSYLLDDECHQCEKGYYCIGGTNARQECPGNRTTAGTGAQSNTACYAHCDANEYMISEAADDCSPCPSGQVSEAHNVYYGNTSTCSSQTTSTCTLTFNSNGGSSCSSNTGGCGGTINTSCSPTRSGYHFDGWYTAASGGSAVSFPLTLNSNMTIYAHWTANCSSCVCGTNGMPESYHCEICTAGQTSCDNVCANYGQSYISSTSCSNLTCTLTFNSNGGSSCSGNSGACGRDIASSTCSPTRSGYSFDGWYTSADGGSAVSFPITLSANRTVYAHWTKNSSGSSGGSTSYTITADANGGTISATTGWTNAADNKTATRSVNSGSTYGTLPTVTYTGKTLKEWNTKSDGTGTAVTSATTATATATIYAIWNNSDDGSGGQGGGDDQTGETKTITFNANGGTFTIDNESKESIEVSGAVTSTC